MAIFDRATGDADPNDARSGTYDPLFGARRFELGPSGLYNLVARTNLRSPGAAVILRPMRDMDVTIQQRRLWLDQARDSWQSSTLRDRAGMAGSQIGWQTDLRLRYRWKRFFEFDGALVILEEGDVPRRVKPAPAGHTTFLTTALEVRF